MERRTNKENAKDLMRKMKEDPTAGMAVVEVILILVVLITLVLIFKSQLTGLLENVLGDLSTLTEGLAG